MAEFKLGRIRFVWKGDWTTSTTYYKDDVVGYGGKIYICVLGHSSAADFFTDLNVTPTKWNIVSEGQRYRTGWEPNVEYIPGDIVKYGARLYFCNTVHTSASDSTIGLESDSDKWDIYAEGLDWKGEWQTSFDYKENDFVKYGGTTYVCITPHISAATDTLGLENDSANWEIFNKGFDYKDTWASSTRYKVNDVVRYGANLWIAISAHTSTSNFQSDSANWQKFVEGFQFEDEWNIFAEYQPGDIVRYGGNQYIAKTNHTGSIPPTATNDWDLFSTGLRFLGDWGDDSSAFEYQIGDVVRLGGYTYRCIQDHQSQQPPNTLYWERLNTGLDWRGEWLDDQEYFLGDIVRYGDNSYVCVQGHISEGDDFSTETLTDPGGGAENSRPDLDIAGAYWNIIAVGSEQSVLTTTGDLVYYSGAAPTRLPIGQNGQVLQVSSAGIPEWAFLGQADDVYYVSPDGVDSPAPIYGKSIDRPWKTIRYAATQVERGANNLDAAKLLEINRRFIQREIVEWTDQQITSNTSPFTSSFSYNSEKCERDMGLIIDALIWDITHGGNVRSREAALSYINDTVGSPYLSQKTETVASINYGLTVIGNVLAQTDPTINYQVLNGDNSTAIVEQYKNTSLVAESGVLTEITSLVGIITDAITAGNTDNIPERIIKTTLIKVSTGKYYETLPIIVPAECCVMGDELRSVTAYPRKESNSTLTPATDFKYSYTALDRLENIVGDIVTGVSVTPTTGNTQTQDQSWPYAETAVVAPAVEKLSRSIKRQIDSKLGNKIGADLTNWYDMSDTNAGRARDLIKLNKDFIVAEVMAFLADPDDGYPNLKYSRTKCKQDIGFILDAIQYDLTYGGNWQSVVAGEAYYNGTNGTLQISASEKTPTLAAYAYLKELCQTVGRNITVTPTYQTTTTQVDGIGGVAGTATTIGGLFDNIIDIITNGPETVSITFPTISGTTNFNAFTALEGVLDNVKETTIDFISKNFGSFTYDSGKCRRDLRKIITDTSYDVALGTNFNSVYTGIAYQRASSYTVLNDQKTETVGAIRYARDQLKETVTTDGSSASGSSNASDRIQTAFNEIVDIINNGTLSVTEPNDGTADALSFPSPTGVDQNRVDAKDNLIANKTFIVEDIIAYITNTYGAGFVYDATKCRRDVRYIVDSLCYDILYGGTQASTRVAESYFVDGVSQLGASEATETAAAYAHLKTVVRAVVTEDGTYVKQSGNGETQTTLGTPATSAEADELDDDIDLFRNVIVAGNTDSLPAAVYPDITWADAEYQTAHSNISSDREDVIKDTIQYINTTYNDFNYNQAKCSRDIGLILQAAKYDFALSTNFASIVAGLSYLRQPSNEVLTDQKTASVAAFEYARQQFIAAVPGGTDYDYVRSGINSTWEWVDDTLFGGSGEGGNSQVADQEVYNAIRMLELNKEFIVEEVINYVDDYYKKLVTTVNTVANTYVVSSTDWLELNMPIKFTNLDDSANSVLEAGLDPDATYFVKDIVSDTEFKISQVIGGSELSTPFSQNFYVEKAYEYDATLCARDVREYIEAIKWDLTWPQEWKREYTDSITLYRPASYKTRLAARYYANSVIGSQEEDFFYLRNATGLRLMTLDGLQGDLGPENEYGTSRPTAGAYASLDPGWGPDDERVWISARSPYVQNCTTFGFAAVGQKIDGALHNGGNDSIVSNDFTQVISDGIGAWITNNGRGELVSVFTYYSHIGYLCETGGRMRATNGNNSYGKFGSVAEGVDPEETPVTAIVDNRTQYNATIGNVLTDQDTILSVEYSHAGNEYTEAAIEFFGAGENEETSMDDFRDGAVSQVRIIEVDDSSGNPDATAGGSGYLIVSNTAQSGTSSSITLAATDGNTSTAYPGMKLIITSGQGVGQFGIVDTYNSGTKVATIVKESDGTAGFDHVVPGTTIVSPNSTSIYQIEPAVAFTAPTNSTSAETIASATYNAAGYFETSAQYTNVSVTSDSDGVGVTFDVTRNGSKYYLSINSAGTGYTRLDTVVIPGTSVGGTSTANDITITITSINSATGAVVDFDFEGLGQKGVYIALPSTGTAAKTSVDATDWSTASTLDSSATWTDFASGLLDDGSTTYAPSTGLAVGHTGGSVVVNYTGDGSSWTTNSPAISVTSAAKVAFGNVGVDDNRFVIIGDNDRDVAYTANGGASYTVTSNALPTSTGYNCLAFGLGLFVALANGTNQAAYSSDGVTWAAGAGLASDNWVDVAFGNGRFVAITDNTVGSYSLDGQNWVATTLPGTTETYKQITYGQGVFVATRDDNVLAVSEDGLLWTTYTIGSEAAGYNAATFGNPGQQGKFVTIGASTPTTTVGVSQIGAKAKGRVGVANEQVFEVRLTDPGSNYASAPTITITDPNNINDVLTTVRLGNGVLGQPSFINRGSGFTGATAEISDTLSNGFADFFQDGTFIAVRRLSSRPVNGSNIVFGSLPGQFFKLVNTISFIGSNDGSYTAFLQVSPAMEIEDAPSDGDSVTMRIRFSQVRLTGHDFLDIGTGNFTDTNYPGVPVNTPTQANETVDNNGGRVFFTATDQDGNFRVGDLFSIEQSTGVATLNAEAFNIAGLQELSLGEVTLGGNSASITEFSTDPFFTANSDTVVPTQRAVKAYIESQIGGGGAALNVNSVTAGDVFINTNQITTVTGQPINIKANIVFSGAVLGTPLAYNYFLR